jgi:hypothetical protein
MKYKVKIYGGSAYFNSKKDYLAFLALIKAKK